MIARVLWTGVIAGLIAGALATGVQMVRLVPLIQSAEVYESAAMQTHDHGAVAVSPASAVASTSDVHKPSAHEHDAEWEPEGFLRTALTAGASILTGIGYGLLLAAGMTLVGRPLDARTGLLWGLAGFVVFAAAPAFGLPPEVPGMAAAELGARQVWWLGTAVATAAGIAVAAFAPSRLKAAAVLLLIAPHVIGAPHVGGGAESAGVPAEIAAQFVAASLISALLFWLALGASAGHLLSRRERAS
jgi:cobalt transporter subunit CbtA